MWALKKISSEPNLTEKILHIHLPKSRTSALLAMAFIIAMVPQAFPIVCFMKYTFGLTSWRIKQQC